MLVGSRAGVSASRLRALALHAAFAQASQLRWYVASVQSWPWRLCIGDPIANLKELAAMRCAPGEVYTADKIGQLLQLDDGHIPQILQGIQLMPQLSRSTKKTEEGHARPYSAVPVAQAAGGTTAIAWAAFASFAPFCG